MSTEKEGFASRWSRRKHEGADVSAAAVPTVEALQPSQPQAFVDSATDDGIIAGLTRTLPVEPADSSAEAVVEATSAAEQDAEPPVLTDADMPPLESLNGESDVSGFFSKGVSSALRQAALRQIFSSPRYNVRDGLNDYDGDYTVFEPLGDTVTADMKYHAARKEAARLAALEEEKEREALARQEQESEARQLEEGDEETDSSEEISEEDSDRVADSEDDVTTPVADGHPDTPEQSIDLADSSAEPASDKRV